MRPDARAPWPAGDGEMAELIRSHDWGATPLGPIAAWPASLRVAARLMLTTQHPMFIWWGPELIQLYNDAYRATMGPEKHPAALGGRGRDTWGEIWGTIGPQIAQVMRGGPATWHEDQLVPVTRRGSREDVWWTYSFSPIDQEGAPNGVGGVMVICRDVTQEHLAKRTAQENEARYRELFEAMEEGYLVADVIFDGEDRAVDIEYREANPAATRMVGTDLTGRRLREVDPRYEEHWYETFGRVARTGVGETGVQYAEPGDVWYEFRVSKLKAADPTSTRITVRFLDVSARVRTELALRQSEERQAHLLQLSDALRPLTSPIDIQHVAMQILGRRLGVSRAQYYVADETGDYLTSSGGYTDGVPAAVGRFRLIEFGRYAYDGFHAGQTQVVSDAAADPRIAEAVLRSYEAVGFLAYIGVPFVQRGRLVGTVAVHQAGPRRWTDSERRMVEETAERAGAAIEQARAEQALRESEALRRIAIEGGGMGTWRWDLRDRLVWGDARFMALWGLPPSDDAHPLSLFADRMSPTGAREMTEMVAEAVAAGEEFDGQLAVVAGTTAGSWIRWRGRAERERTWIVNGVSFDVTAQRLADDRLRESEERQAFLLELSDALRPVADPTQMLRVAMRVLGTHLDVTRAQYYEVDDGGEHAESSGVFTERAPPGGSRIRFDDFGPHIRDAYENNQKIVSDDCFADGRLSEAERSLYRARSVRAIVGVPLVKGGRLVAMLGISNATVRHWTAVEIGLIEETAERTWAAVERARAEAALRDSEEQQRLMTELVPALLWRADPTGQDVVSTDRWKLYTGQSGPDVQRYGWLDAVHPDDREATRAAFAHAFATGEPLERQQRIRQAGNGYRWHLVRHLPVRGEDGAILRWYGAAIDIHELHELQARQGVMVAELQHRTRNLITVVQSLAERTLDGAASLGDFAERFDGRLSALSRVQGLLSHLSTGDRVCFDELLRSELAALGAPDGHTTLDGPAGVPLRSATAQTLALALHELATNAAKYGALSPAGGHLRVAWRVEPAVGGADPVLHVDWRESGVAMPTAGAPARGGGYGRELIEEALPYQLKATTRYALGPDGVACTIAVPIPPDPAAEDRRP